MHEEKPAAQPAALEDAETERLQSLQKRISVTFRRPELLREAMTHASWNNERLEYLGDAVLELVVGEYLFRRFPGYDEGQLTQLRAALVNTTSLARLAERLELGETLLLGRGAAKTGARKLPSLLANAFEALIGAIFLDQGYRAATRVFLQNVGDLTEWSDENFKGKLQEVSQERTGDTPRYRVVATGGPGHSREYSAEVLLAGNVSGSGRGRTKQAAEQAAAHDALERLRRLDRTPAVAAAGAARDAVRGASAEPARVRRRVAEVAAARGASSVRRPKQETPAAAEPRQGHRGLLTALRTAAEALVGRRQPPPPPQPEPRKRSRRGRRGGRGRGGPRADAA
ncbi:MAG: ribonuclease III [Candidatus Dormibacteraeota bacterium]|nr:ribonuclease III [Candidatus Dormibacteraeota bacterium]